MAWRPQHSCVYKHLRLQRRLLLGIQAHVVGLHLRPRFLLQLQGLLQRVPDRRATLARL